MHRRWLGIAGGLILALTVAGTAFADSCLNVSRAPAACGWTCSSPVIVGNWAWLPSIGVPIPHWGFAPPGSPEAVAAGIPDAHGNYQNGYSEWLLGHSAYCLKGVNNQRFTGVVSGCGQN